MKTETKHRSGWNGAGIALATLVGMCALSGCVVVGWSSSGGGFIWPGGLGLIVILLVVFLLMRRR